MKKTAFFLLAIISLNGLAFDIPEKFLGEYSAEIESYKFKDNENYYKASAHMIKVVLKEDMVWYQSGKMIIEGSYRNVHKVGADYLFDINISNSKSIDFNFNIDINKKTGVILLSGLKGIPDTRMSKKMDKPEKNNRFGRL